MKRRKRTKIKHNDNNSGARLNNNAELNHNNDEINHKFNEQHKTIDLQEEENLSPWGRTRTTRKQQNSPRRERKRRKMGNIG